MSAPKADVRPADQAERVRPLTARPPGPALPQPLFRTPEAVAPELGMTGSELRNYCRVSGIHTRLSRRRIMLHDDDVGALVEWLRSRKQKKDEWWKEPENDPFA